MTLSHRGLDGERLDVLPVLLEEGDEEVDTQHGVGEDLIGGHLDVSDGDSETEDLLKLELDGGTNFQNLGSEIFGVGDGAD